MAKQKAPALPATPTFQADPIASQMPGQLQSYGQGLLGPGILTDPVLGEAVNLNPQMTQLTLQGLQAQLAPQLRDSRQAMINQLEANNQLTGSTTASSLANIQSDYESQMINAGAQAGIADITRALQNRVGLYGTGLNTLQAAGQLAQGNQSQVNTFNLENYQNQVAKVYGEAKQNGGGLLGAGLGGIAGGIAGSMIGQPILGASIGAGLGGFGPSGTGGSLLQASAGLYGSMRSPQMFGYQPTTSSTASPIFSGESINNSLSTKYPSLFGGY